MKIKFYGTAAYVGIISSILLLLNEVVTSQENAIKCSMDFENALISVVKFDNFTLYEYPSYDLEKDAASYGEATLNVPGGNSDSDAEFFVSWVSKNLSVIVARDFLIMNNKAIKVPKKCKNVWLLNGVAVCPEIGILEEADLTDDLVDLIKLNKSDCVYIYNDVKYIIKDSIAKNSVLKKITNDEHALIVGNRYFRIIGDVLVYSGKSYAVNKGDVVTVNGEGNLTIDPKK